MLKFTVRLTKLDVLMLNRKSTPLRRGYTVESVHCWKTLLKVWFILFHRSYQWPGTGCWDSRSETWHPVTTHRHCRLRATDHPKNTATPCTVERKQNSITSVIIIILIHRVHVSARIGQLEYSKSPIKTGFIALGEVGRLQYVRRWFFTSYPITGDQYFRVLYTTCLPKMLFLCKWWFYFA